MALYDVFISHASEDKDSFVRPLAQKLADSHVEVWYDEFSLALGDSLRESIDRGLADSRYGVVVLSPNFFKKNWPQRELNGLVAREMAGTEKVILPIWHNITKQELIAYSPPLADAKAVSSSEGIEEVATQILKVVKPQGSPLLIARDRLIDFGLQPPVVTDEWWLDVVEASNREPCWGFIPHQQHWGRWTFPLPDKTGNPEDRGELLAWTAMQMRWETGADKIPITQITHPNEVIDFIMSQNGLYETCLDFPEYLIEYAPQLTIHGFGGVFENTITELYQQSLDKYNKRNSQQSTTNDRQNVDTSIPLCDEALALRHPSFGNYEPISIASQFISGEMHGPSVRYYENIDTCSGHCQTSLFGCLH